MREEKYRKNGISARMIICNTAVVGTGAAGYNAADCLWQYGQKDIVIVTENRLGGTSRNTGSDKQTYYKLTLAGHEGDSVGEMAKTLFEGGCVDGDIALCEAALSTECFMKLVELGLPFPRNRWGEFVGYRTDHDLRRRATSVGPYTSRLMVEQLEQSVMEKGIPLLDHLQVIHILKKGNTVEGLLCLDRSAEQVRDSFVLIRCSNIVYATGGPAGMYEDSVYPYTQYGATGLAFEAGAAGKNLTEWQFGLASIRPRWNVSGTYMQSLPRIYSIDADGEEEYDFLSDYYPTTADVLNQIFLKGYQWPFDVRKAREGSSVIDLLVYLERLKGRRVFLDYRTNPFDVMPYEQLCGEAKDYLKKAGACFGTPYDRLKHMNEPSVEFYMEHGVDLRTQPLEISLCAQHNNGGLEINSWWQTTVEGLFAAGEVAASHGVYRPGGTALNAGQVGSTRAAQYISAIRKEIPGSEFSAEAEQAILRMSRLRDLAYSRSGNVRDIWKSAAHSMSIFAGPVRCCDRIQKYIETVQGQIDSFEDIIAADSISELGQVYRLRDMLLCQQVYLSAMLNYLEAGGKSRGSALYLDHLEDEDQLELADLMGFHEEDQRSDSCLQEVCFCEGKYEFRWRGVRPIPDEDDFFENVWRDYRNHAIYEM